jgi:hypothetical protein
MAGTTTAGLKWQLLILVLSVITLLFVAVDSRVLAALLMAAGVGLFGTLTAYLANAWVARQQRDPDGTTVSFSTEGAVTVSASELRSVMERLERIERRRIEEIESRRS